MINLIIKRDGRVEPFTAQKVNGWGEWAAKTLGEFVDWSDVVMEAVRNLPETCSTRDLQDMLIKTCIERDTWSYNRMAGRLYAAQLHKDLYNGKMPTVQDVHANLQKVGFMVKLNYTAAEYAQINELIKHRRDFSYAHFQLHHIRYKYALRNRITGVELESPQYVFMRMAMALAEKRPTETRLHDVAKWYDLFSRNVINAPTPNYVNLGTPLNGYASCCLYTTEDNARSLAVGDHIAYTMTVSSAGIGANLQTRSINDPVRGGLIRHQGKFFYLDALKGAVKANLQNGRGGACNVFYSAFDPEVEMLSRLKNPMTPASRQIREMDYTMLGNKFLARKAARNEDVFTFNIHTAPDLYKSMFVADQTLFGKLYEKYEQDESFKKNWVSAREIVINTQNEAYETGRAYLGFIDEINRHTPYKQPIYSSNLCVEIVQPTNGYMHMLDLYSGQAVGHNRVLLASGETRTFNVDHPVRLENGSWDSGHALREGMTFIDQWGDIQKVDKQLSFKDEPEVGLCSLGGLVITNIRSEEEYAEAMYYCLLMIDVCIHKSEYELPHVGYTAKARMAAAVGIMDFAHHMARLGLQWTTQEGKAEIHRCAERHYYHAMRASLRLGQELGNAPWMHRSKYADGWLPLDTYQKNVDSIVKVENQYDWEALRAEVIANRGIRNSTLVAYMPGESSSKASGTANSIYPIRQNTIVKTDGNLKTYWAAPFSDQLEYQFCWDIPNKDHIEGYALWQKFTDQGISADLYRKIQGSEKVGSDEMLTEYFQMVKQGLKTRYYLNSHTAKSVSFHTDETAEQKKVREEAEVARALEVTYYTWLEDNNVTHGSPQAIEFRRSLGVTAESEYLLHLYKGEIEAQRAEMSMAGGCAGGGCTL